MRTFAVNIKNMNKLDKDYCNLLQDILDNGVEKHDRTGTGTISVFGRTIRHKMSDGFPVLTTKKLFFKGVSTELIWFLRGETNIKWLVERNCNIWNGDAYKKYCNDKDTFGPLTMEQFVEDIKTNEKFAAKWGELGPIYGKQWRQWQGWSEYGAEKNLGSIWYNQIGMLIHSLKINPDSRRLMVNAWNVAEIDKMTLPPCHYGFQCYTRELSDDERALLLDKKLGIVDLKVRMLPYLKQDFDKHNIPTRELSLVWTQRSCDTFLGLPFNIASYGLLLTILSEECNMVPGELIGQLGDTHIYSNHVEQAKEQIGRVLTSDERKEIFEKSGRDFNEEFAKRPVRILDSMYDYCDIPKRTREPFELPTLKINAKIGKYAEVNPFYHLKEGRTDDFFSYLRTAEPSDFELENYKSHPKIDAPLSN